MPNRLSAFLLAVAAAALVVAGCTPQETAAPRGEQGFVAGSGTIEVIPVDERADAPDLSGTTLDGKTLDLSALRGDVVLINVWASWCAPCRAEAPALQTVYEDVHDEGVEFVGIATRDDEANARAFERRFGITYPSLIDPEGDLVLRFRETLPPQAIPTTLIIDRDGKMAVRALTPLTERRLRELVQNVLDEEAAPDTS